MKTEFKHKGPRGDKFWEQEVIQGTQASIFERGGTRVVEKLEQILCNREHSQIPLIVAH